MHDEILLRHSLFFNGLKMNFHAIGDNRPTLKQFMGACKNLPKNKFSYILYGKISLRDLASFVFFARGMLFDLQEYAECAKFSISESIYGVMGGKF